MLVGIVLLALRIGGIQDLSGNIFRIVIILIVTIALVALCYFLFRYLRNYRPKAVERDSDYVAYLNTLPPSQARGKIIPDQPSQADSATPDIGELPPEVAKEEPPWILESVYYALCKIDWYEFEKFCSTLLRNEGYLVERKGGAHPDGGVDLIATKDADTCLVQCKHWKTWNITPKTVRELVGTMTINQTSKGAIYTIKGPSIAALELANQQGIQIEGGYSLADRALRQLSKEQLDSILKTDVHHCPKCEAEMVWREGRHFKSFWGCSRYPRCSGKLEYTGAR